MVAGLSEDVFWDLTEEQALRHIHAYQMRMEQWDDILAHHALLTTPKRPKTGKFKLKDFKYYRTRSDRSDEPSPDEPTPDELEEARERRERMREQRRARGVPEALKKRYGDDVKIRDLT